MTSLTKLSEKAFAIMAICPEAKRFYGITVDQIRRNAFKFVWTFPIDKEKAHREGYDSHQVHGSIENDSKFPGCPYCKSQQFLFCSCGAVVCWHGERYFKCPVCNQSGETTVSETFDLQGGGF